MGADQAPVVCMGSGDGNANAASGSPPILSIELGIGQTTCATQVLKFLRSNTATLVLPDADGLTYKHVVFDSKDSNMTFKSILANRAATPNTKQ